MRKKIPEITMYFVCTPFRDGILQLESVTYIGTYNILQYAIGKCKFTYSTC